MTKGDATSHPRHAAPPALPIRRTTFVGRRRLLAQVVALLAEHRTVTLTGTGGCGKTRLACEVSRRVGDRYADGVAFVDVAPVASLEALLGALAAAFDLDLRSPRSAMAAFVDAVESRRALLVLDSCERVVDDCARLVDALLAQCPGVDVLTTSREPLRVEGEVTVQVSSLSLPSPDAEPLVALRRSEAGALMLDRARLACPGYEPTTEQAAALAAICHRLDGIPLAIELAASRLRALDATAIAAALTDRFRLLNIGLRTAPPRHRTLHASMDWSHDLLDPLERALFRRLAVFPASFPAEAAIAVSASDDLPSDSVLAVLASLVERSLVEAEQGGAGPRYRQLETVRAYAHLRLVEAGEEHEARDRHLRHWSTKATQWEADVQAAADPDVVLDAVDASLADLRAAMEWSAAAGRPAVGREIATALRFFWIGRSRTQEGRTRLAASVGPDDNAADRRGQARALTAAAHLCHHDADPVAQRALAAEALAVAEQVGDRCAEQEALVLLGWGETFLDPSAARPHLARALTAFEEDVRPHVAVLAHAGLAGAWTNEGDLAAAADEASLACQAADGRPLWGARASSAMLGCLRALQGRLHDAERHLAEASSARWGTYDRFHQDFAAQWLGFVRTAQGAYDEAARTHDEAMARAQAAGHPPLLGWLHRGILELALGNPDRAAECGTRALRRFRYMQWRWFEARALRLLGDAAAQQHDHRHARARWHEAAVVAEASGSAVAQVGGAIGQAMAADVEGNGIEARRLAGRALVAALRADFRLGAVDALDLVAVLAARGESGDHVRMADAARLLAAANSVRTRMGYLRFPSQQPAFDAAIADVRHGLGDRFLPEWSAGARLTLDEAAAAAVGRSPRRPRPSDGWSALTPAERRVVRLVTLGLTNAQIGERLYVSRRTVQTHLAHVFEKLGVANRAALAAEATRQGDVLVDDRSGAATVRLPPTP